MGQMMPPPQMGAPRPRGWRERLLYNYGGSTPMSRTKDFTIPNWLTGKAMVFFFISIFLCWGAYGFVPDFDLSLVACISVVLFFYGSMSFSKSWCNSGEKTFIKNVFVGGLVARLVFVLYLYFIFNQAHYQNTYGSGSDVDWYMPFGEAIAQWVKNGFNEPLSKLINRWYCEIDDVGYPMWLGMVYLIVGEGNDVFAPFVLKCIMGAYCAVAIYRVAKRHFGEGTARLTAIFIALNPNMIYWCGSMMKEAEMVFLACLAIDNFDRVLTSGKKYTFRALLPGMLAGIALFFFRTALAMTIFMAVFAHIVMTSQRVMSMGKKIIAGVLVSATLIVGMGDRLREQTRSMYDVAQSDAQSKNMEWRGTRQGGNSFAKYAGAAVFAPLIFTIPFPTYNQANIDQLVQVQLAGGSYIKNILSFFVIIVMLLMLISGEWRRHVFILAYTVGYLVILVFSAYAQSGRFHMPVMPMLMLFAAYGVQLAKGQPRFKRMYSIVLVVEVVACLAWNWFKLKGRGMI